ncbi:hypothetical protein D049_3692B, partial [Vibrio parahaemolyticus VPTS-2010]
RGIDTVDSAGDQRFSCQCLPVFKNAKQ